MDTHKIARNRKDHIVVSREVIDQPNHHLQVIQLVKKEPPTFPLNPKVKPWFVSFYKEGGREVTSSREKRRIIGLLSPFNKGRVWLVHHLGV